MFGATPAKKNKYGDNTMTKEQVYSRLGDVYAMFSRGSGYTALDLSFKEVATLKGRSVTFYKEDKEVTVKYEDISSISCDASLYGECVCQSCFVYFNGPERKTIHIFSSMKDHFEGYRIVNASEIIKKECDFIWGYSSVHLMQKIMEQSTTSFEEGMKSNMFALDSIATRPRWFAIKDGE